MVCPGTNQVDGISKRLSSANRRSAPTTPNSPREIGVGEVSPREMKPDKASKSKVRQTMCRAIVTPLRSRVVYDLVRINPGEHCNGGSADRDHSARRHRAY